MATNQIGSAQGGGAVVDDGNSFGVTAGSVSDPMFDATSTSSFPSSVSTTVRLNFWGKNGPEN